MHFLALHRAGEVQPGSDFLFWYWFTQGLKRLLVRDQYLPALVYRQDPTPKGKRKQAPYAVYGAWQWAPEPFDQLLAQASACMPPVCAAGLDGLAQGETLLRHCAEVLLDVLVRQTPWPAALTKKTDRTLLAACLAPAPTLWKAPGTGLDSYRQWQGWRARITGTAQDAACTLGFQLLEPPDGGQDAWALQFVVVPRDDPSQRLALADYWSEPAAGRARLRRQVGQDFERHLLLSLGLAARVYPRLWAGLETAEPQSVALDLDAAFDFLKEMLAFWHQHGQEMPELRVQDLLQRTAEDDRFEVDHDDALAALLEVLTVV